MSAICENFVQNAWRKDLCSNCFKLKQDHHVCSKSVDTFNEKYIHEEASVYHSNSDSVKVQAATTWKGLAIQKNFIHNGYIINGISTTEHDHTSIQTCNGFLEKFQVIPTSILKNGHRKSSTGSVGFREEDPQIIGYGGEFEAASAEDSEDEESDQFEDCDSLENFEATEEDKEFMKLTEKNTEFNSLHRNLLVPSTEEKSPTVAKYNCEGGSSVCIEKEVISKPVDEEQSGGNRFHLPRAAIRPFCRESVSSILDAKATNPAPEVHYDEDGHVVINEMNSRNIEEKEVVAYEVSPVSKIAPESLESMFMTTDLPPELPKSPPPDELEQPLANSTCMKDLEKPVKIKPIVPAKPKSRTPECCGLNSDSDSSSSPSSEEIYQDTRDVFHDSDDMKELSFKDKIANLNNNLDFNRKSTKRQAPQPPPSTGVEETVSPDTTNTNTPLAVIMRNPPVKRINSSSSDAEDQDQVNGLRCTPIAKPMSPPITRKAMYAGNAKLRTCHSLDVSSTRILLTPMSEDNNKKLKGKFSLKKLLKFGKDGEDNTRNKSSSYSGTTLEKKVKLEILHPMDLANLSSSNPTTPNGDWDPLMTGEAGTFTYLNEDKIMSSSPGSPKSPAVGVTKVKPPPPPRIKNETGAQNKPSRPPPPFKGLNDSSTTVVTSPETKEKNRNKCETNAVDLMPCAGGEYANLGEVRVVLAPKKPERNSPASIRKDHQQYSVETNEDKEKTEFTPEHLYCEPPDSLVNSTTEDEVSETSTLKASSPPMNKVSRHSRNAKAVGMVFPDSGFAEVSSTDSDAGSVSSADGQFPSPKVELSNLYAEVKKKETNSKPRQMVPKHSLDDIAPPVPPPPPPPRHHQSESLSTDIDESSLSTPRGTSPEPVSLKCYNGKWKKCSSLRANCSGIRGDMEENYNALVTANHEALAKIVEQVSTQKNVSCFAGLQDTPLRWVDFKVGPVALAKLEHTAFYSAIWGSNTEVTLMVSEDIFPIPFPAKAPFLLSPLATFQDFIPLDFESEVSETKLHHRMIWVFPPVKVQSVENFSAKLKTLVEEDVDNCANLITFLLLQLISALKHLQADGIEEVGYPPDWVVVMGCEDEDCTNLSLNLIGSSTRAFPHPDANSYSLCACALLIMRLLLTGDANSDVEDICNVIPDNVSAKTTFRVVLGILENEKATSLSQVKAILEMALYGPKFGPKHNESALQRWLDLEKAFALSNLISCVNNRSELTVFQNFHLRFLTRTNSRSLRDAMLSLTCSKA